MRFTSDYSKWDAQMEATARSMFEDGASDNEIAIAVGRTPKAVERKRNLMGLMHRRAKKIADAPMAPRTNVAAFEILPCGTRVRIVGAK